MSRRLHRALAALLVLTLALAGAALIAPRASAAVGDTGGSQTDAAYLGVTVVTLDARTARLFGLEQTDGVVIASVVKDSPAAAAGLARGDVIRAVNGVAVATTQDVVTEVQKAKAGDVVTLDITRKGTALSVPVTAGSAPAAVDRSGRPRWPTPEGRTTPQAKPTPKPKTTPEARPTPAVPPALKPLLGLGDGALFGNYYGSTHTYKDADGNVVTVRIIPGTVTAISATSITIRPNDPQSNGGPYTIDDATIIRAQARVAGADAIKVDDRVVVVVIGDSNHAALISKGGISPLGRFKLEFKWPLGRGSFKFEWPGGLRDCFPEQATPTATDKGA